MDDWRRGNLAWSFSRIVHGGKGESTVFIVPQREHQLVAYFGMLVDVEAWLFVKLSVSWIHIMY